MFNKLLFYGEYFNLNKISKLFYSKENVIILIFWNKCVKKFRKQK